MKGVSVMNKELVNARSNNAAGKTGNAFKPSAEPRPSADKSQTK